MNTNMNATKEERLCPYRNDAPCLEANCPYGAWIEDEDFADCLFHVALSEVKELFLKAARFLDDKLGLESGQGQEALQGIREMLQGPEGPINGRVIGAVLGALKERGVLDSLVDPRVADVISVIEKVEALVDFEFGELFPVPDRAGDEE